MVTASRTPKSPLHSAFRPSEGSPTKYGYHQQQLRTTVQLLKRVEESLCGAPRLHRHPEEKGYRYSLNTGLWYDPVSKLWYDLTFTFDDL